MALTGHEVVCFDEEGKPAIAELESGEFKVVVDKEDLVIINSASPSRIYMKEGVASFGDIQVFAERRNNVLYFFISAGSPLFEEKIRFGLVKATYYSCTIRREDVEYLFIFLLKVISQFPTNVLNAVSKIDKIMKYDQGDLLFVSLKGVDPKTIFVPAWMEKYNKIFYDALDGEIEHLRKAHDRLLDFARKHKKLPGILKRLKKHKLTQEDVELLQKIIEEVLWRLVLW